jgi:hypothetical protein
MSRNLITVTVVAFVVLLCGNVYADNLNPISVTGFNVDGMWGPDGGNGGGYVEKEPGPSPNIVTSGNTGYRYAFFAAGSVSAYGFSLANGAPIGNFTSAANATNTYCFAPAGGDNVASKNMLRIDSVASGNANTGTLTLATPGMYSSIGILADTWLNSRSYSNIVLGCTLHFADGATQIATYDASTYLGTPTSSVIAVAPTIGARDVMAAGFPGNDHLMGVWSDGGVVRSANIYESMIAIDPANQSKMLTSITFDGITGNADRSTLIYAVSGSPVPEPGTLAMVGAALIGLLCYAWRKRR